MKFSDDIVLYSEKRQQKKKKIDILQKVICTERTQSLKYFIV